MTEETPTSKKRKDYRRLSPETTLRRNTEGTFQRPPSLPPSPSGKGRRKRGLVPRDRLRHRRREVRLRPYRYGALSADVFGYTVLLSEAEQRRRDSRLRLHRRKDAVRLQSSERPRGEVRSITHHSPLGRERIYCHREALTEEIQLFEYFE